MNGGAGDRHIVQEESIGIYSSDHSWWERSCIVIVGVSGYGATGASAYMDILSEFENIRALKGVEFQLLQETDGLIDLAFHVTQRRNRLAESFAMERFLRVVNGSQCDNLNRVTSDVLRQRARGYLDAISTVHWKGRSGFQPADFNGAISLAPINRALKWVNRVTTRLIGKNAYPKHMMRQTDIGKERFVAETKEFLKDVIAALPNEGQENIALEQLFSTSNPCEGFEYFDDVRSIVVDRDPRDVYVLTNYLLPHIATFMPHDKDVRSFVEYWRAIHVSNETCDETDAKGKVLHVRFEDLVFARDETVSVLERFLGLRHGGDYGRFFDPAASANNTCLYKTHCQEKSDIEYIEQHLSEFLYDFDAQAEDHFARIPMKPF